MFGARISKSVTNLEYHLYDANIDPTTETNSLSPPIPASSPVRGGRPRSHNCGICTKCCELLPVAEIWKPGFTHCKHEGFLPAITGGCTIYSKRPRSCAAWSCWWLQNDDWPDELRPDLCGVVFDGTPDVVTIDGVRCNAVQAWVAAGHENDFKVAPVAEVVFTIVSAGVALVWHLAPTEAGGDERSCVIYRDGDKFICSTPRTPGRLTVGSCEAIGGDGQ